MVNIDYTVFIQIVNFVALIFILNALLYKPILALIDERKQKLSASEEEIKRLKMTAEQQMAAYEQTLREAKLGALDEKNSITKEGAELARGIIDDAREEIPRIMEDFNEKLAREVDEARRVLTSSSQQISIEIAERVLGRSLQ